MGEFIVSKIKIKSADVPLILSFSPKGEKVAEA
jgi:hypothetical protein